MIIIHQAELINQQGGYIMRPGHVTLGETDVLKAKGVNVSELLNASDKIVVFTGTVITIITRGTSIPMPTLEEIQETINKAAWFDMD